MRITFIAQNKIDENKSFLAAASFSGLVRTHGFTAPIGRNWRWVVYFRQIWDLREHEENLWRKNVLLLERYVYSFRF